MSAIFLIIGLFAGAAGIGWFVKSSQEARFGARVRELESKLRFSHGEILNLKENLTTVRAQAVAAEKTLTEERMQHTTALSMMAASFKRGILALTAAYFTAGLVFGGSAGWFGASWKLGASEAREKTQFEMDARLAGLKAELLQKQVDRLAQSSDFFEKALREERVVRAVAMTKLQILLESVTPVKGGEGFWVDDQKLKKNLKDKVEVDVSYKDFPIPQSAARP